MRDVVQDGVLGNILEVVQELQQHPLYDDLHPLPQMVVVVLARQEHRQRQVARLDAVRVAQRSAGDAIPDGIGHALDHGLGFVGHLLCRVIPLQIAHTQCIAWVCVSTVRPNKKETRFISEISSLLRKI